MLVCECLHKLRRELICYCQTTSASAAHAFCLCYILYRGGRAVRRNVIQVKKKGYVDGSDTEMSTKQPTHQNFKYVSLLRQTSSLHAALSVHPEKGSNDTRLFRQGLKRHLAF